MATGAGVAVRGAALAVVAPAPTNRAVSRAMRRLRAPSESLPRVVAFDIFRHTFQLVMVGADRPFTPGIPPHAPLVLLHQKTHSNARRYANVTNDVVRDVGTRGIAFALSRLAP